jgi:Domain of unknown function (DUF4340)
MSRNRLLFASALLVALLGLTIWKWKAQQVEYTKPADVTVSLPKLSVSEISQLELTTPGNPTIKLEKQASGAWRMKAPVAAEADKGAVETAVAKLAELEVLGVAATKAESHALLEVTEDKATHVVAKHGPKLLVDLLIGRYRSGNTSVRQQGATLVASVKGSIKFAFDKTVKDFRDRTIVEVAAEKVQSARFVSANGAFAFVSEAGAWKQAPGEKPIASFDAEQVKAIVAAAANMTASDFAPADLTADAAGLGSAPLASVQLVATTDLGTEEISLSLGRKLDNGYYLSRKGKDPIYMVSEFVGDRLQPTAAKLAKLPEKPAQPTPLAGSVKKVPVKAAAPADHAH